MGGSKVQGHPWLKGDSRAPEHEEFCPPVPKYLNPRASAITENCKEQGSEVGSEWEGVRDAYFWVFREDGADRGLLLRSRQRVPCSLHSLAFLFLFSGAARNLWDICRQEGMQCWWPMARQQADVVS